MDIAAFSRRRCATGVFLALLPLLLIAGSASARKHMLGRTVTKAAPPVTLAAAAPQEEETVLLDLHVHSICSDGAFAPEQLARMAQEAHLRYFALADHDNVACVQPAARAAKKLGVGFVPAIEISVGDDKMHILGLNINVGAPSIKRLVDAASETRTIRLGKILAALEKMNVVLDTKTDILLPKLNTQLQAEGKPPLSPEKAAKMSLEQVRNLLKGQITRPDIAQALVAKGLVATSQEAFDKYIGNGAPAEVLMDGPDFQQAIAAIHEAGGIAVLAHPYTVYKGRFPPLRYSGKDYPSFQALVKDMLDAGLDGFEAYRPGWRQFPKDVGELKALAASYGARPVFLTAGSDFHGGGVTSVTGLYVDGMPVSMAQPLLKALHLN